jgi:DNA-binding transcriptional LysR family regulator
MELRHLRYFVSVAEALSFTKAAEKLHTAQPSLTRQIKDLEEELGVRLLNRTKQQVTLTDEGRSFLPDAKRILALTAETIGSVRRLHSGEVRALNVGYVSNVFFDFLPRTLASLHKSLPTVSVNLFDMSCGEQFRALEDGKLDLGFVGLHAPIALRGLEFRTIASYKTLVALPQDNPLAGKTTVDLKALASMFFIGMSEASYPGYREWLTKTCEAAGFTPKVLQDVDLERTMIHAVAAGLGVAFVPEQLKRLEHDNVVFRSLSPKVGTEGCVAWRSENPSAALEAYVKIVEQMARSSPAR